MPRVSSRPVTITVAPFSTIEDAVVIPVPDVLAAIKTRVLDIQPNLLLKLAGPATGVDTFAKMACMSQSKRQAARAMVRPPQLADSGGSAIERTARGTAEGGNQHKHRVERGRERFGVALNLSEQETALKCGERGQSELARIGFW